MSEQNGFNKSFQRILLCGYLAKDPELKFLPDGKAVCNFGLVINRENGNGSDYIPSVAWENKAKIIGDNCSKGSLILVEGIFKSSKFKDSEDREQFQLQFEVAGARGLLRLLSSKKDSDGTVGDQS
ncbi:single-stranded DNA-binding protein [Bacillus firmus]|uniref:single-stranded DNA-binding protein n=1 Tax=Cytobacillus firmus TaxID=1399 RepID=UPI001580E87C|nr:single-stranded DNA-binding protein [Cytobacillus firmus]NUH84748.1 single-stranded DNA-binding protein [Cytobacillus firmus]